MVRGDEKRFELLRLLKMAGLKISAQLCSHFENQWRIKCGSDHAIRDPWHLVTPKLLETGKRNCG